jgi:hypothetical protein
MPAFIDLTDRRFGKLIVLKEAGRRNGFVTWACICDCGLETIVGGENLRSGNTRSCGCILKPHGHGHRTPTYISWQNMKLRCHYPKATRYKDWGGRGITVCARWRHSFVNFLTDMGERPPGLVLDRIDNSKGYSPANCRWVTYRESNLNKRHSSR